MIESLHDRIAGARRSLVGAGFRPDEAALDAEVLARHVLGWDRARLVVQRSDAPPAGFDVQFTALVARRARREPVALITGRREFWGRDFLVTAATLIPRPETEYIVEEALRWLPPDASSTVLDVGTGTGCLAVSLAQERPRAVVVATDISLDALIVARRNALAHGTGDRIRLVQTDLVDGLRLRADVIVSNPPYVPDHDFAGMPDDVRRYEPRMALFGGSDGLGVMRRLFATAPRQLAPGGAFIVEFGYGQEAGIREAAADAGWRVERLLHDLQQIPRTIVLRR